MWCWDLPFAVIGNASGEEAVKLVEDVAQSLLAEVLRKVADVKTDHMLNDKTD